MRRSAGGDDSLKALTPKKRGAKPAESNPLSGKVRQLEAKVTRLEKELLDIFSRYVVGWMVAERENAALAARLIEQSCLKQDIQPQVLQTAARP